MPRCPQLHSARVTLFHHLSLTSLLIRLNSRSFAASDLNFVSSSSAKQLSNLLRHSSVCARAVVPVITDPHPGQFMLLPYSCTSDLLIYNLLAARSIALAPARLEGLVRGLASGLPCLREVHLLPSLPPPDSVSRRTLQRREELEIPTLQLWASPHVPRFVHSTWRHDQHLITAVSDTDECSILPQTNLLVLHLQFVSCAPVTTDLKP